MVAIKLGKLWQGVKYSMIAAKGAALYSVDEQRAKRYVRNALAEVPGLGAKMSQLLSDSLGTPDQPCYNRSLPRKLPLEHVARLIATECPELHRRLDSIDPQGFGASLSQVHRALLVDGTEVAIKVQYPGLHESLKDQVDLLIRSAKVTAPPKYQVALSDLSAYFLESFQRELDYKAEAKMQQRFAALVAKGQFPITVPTVYDELSGPTILVQSFEASQPVSDTTTWPKADRYAVADALGQFFLTTMLEHGLVHSDWHSGNFGFSRSLGAKAVLYDYGAILKLSEPQRQAIHALLYGLSRGDAIHPYDHFVCLGFDPDKLSHIAEQLPALCAKVFGPLLSRGRFDFKEWHLAQGIDAVLGTDKWWFRSAGPAWFLQLMRSCFGLFQGIEKLGVGLNLNAEGILAGLPKPAQIPDHSSTLSQKPKAMAKQLKIKVVENGREKADITLPALAVDELEGLLPEAALSAIDFDIAKLRRDVQRSGYMPQMLFEVKTSAKDIRVELR